jgi:hypothetical protein
LSYFLTPRYAVIIEVRTDTSVGFCRTTYEVMLAPSFEIEAAREFKKELPIGKGWRSYGPNLCGIPQMLHAVFWVATFVEKLQDL